MFNTVFAITSKGLYCLIFSILKDKNNIKLKIDNIELIDEEYIFLDKLNYNPQKQME